MAFFIRKPLFGEPKSSMIYRMYKRMGFGNDCGSGGEDVGGLGDQSNPRKNTRVVKRTGS